MEGPQRETEMLKPCTPIAQGRTLSQKDGGLEPRKREVMPARMQEGELWHLGCPDVYTFVVTSRWPNLSRVPGGKTYVLCSKSFWIAALQEKLSVYLFLFVIL